MSLNLHYRPIEFDEIIGNKTTLESLKSYVEGIKDGTKERRSILITGASGCGKTTLARIIGSVLGAYDFEDEMNLDFQEFNAGNVETIKEIRKNMIYAPRKGQFKVYFIDECHRMTAQSQEDFLKPLEEPPGHVVFILATTDPQKLKVTLKRRCAPFQVNPPTSEEVFNLLQEIVEEEEKDVPEEILETIVEVSACSPGVALGNLDTVIDLPKKQMKTKVAQMVEEKELSITLCRKLIGGEGWKSVCKVIKALKDQNEDPEGIRRQIVGYCSAILLKGNNGRAFVVGEAFREPTYNNGFNDLILSAYEAVVGGE